MTPEPNLTIEEAMSRVVASCHDIHAVKTLQTAMKQFETLRRVYDESVVMMNEQLLELAHLRTHSVAMTRAVTELRAKLRERENADGDPSPEVPVLKMHRKDASEGVDTNSLAEALKRADMLCPPRSDGKEIAFAPTMASPTKLERLNAQTAFFMGTLAKTVRAQQTVLERTHEILRAEISSLARAVTRSDSAAPTFESVRALLIKLLEPWDGAL